MTFSNDPRRDSCVASVTDQSSIRESTLQPLRTKKDPQSLPTNMDSSLKGFFLKISAEHRCKSCVLKR